MRVAIFALCVALAGCSGKDSLTAPTSARTAGTPSLAAGGTLHVRAAAAAGREVSVTGAWASGCISKADYNNLPITELVWDVVVANAGDEPLSFMPGMAFHDNEPGCAPTLANPRERIKHVGGPESYPAHGSGTTRFAAPLREWECGRDQFDISIRDGQLLVGMVIDRGVRCEDAPPPEPPPPLPPPPLPPPPLPPPPAFCPPNNELFIGTPSFTVMGDRVTVGFLLRPELVNVRMSLASYKINTAPADRLVEFTEGIFTGLGSMSVTAASCSAQVDLLRCGPPIPVWPDGVEPAAEWYNEACYEPDPLQRRFIR